MTDSTPNLDAVRIAADIVSAYVSNNNVPASELAGLVTKVYGAVTGLSGPVAEVPAEPLKPPVPVKKTLTPDYIVSLEDGKHYKSLKRHLTTRGLTPEQYRTKWGLDRDYPMVAPNYAKQRSDLAKAIGLGRGLPRPLADAPVAEAPAPAPVEVKEAKEPKEGKAPRGRRLAKAA